MHIRTYHTLPPEAIAVRLPVFVEEQGFVDEVDEIDNTTATHLVLFDGDAPIGTCRLFPADTNGTYILGRLAVLRPYRGRGCGSQLITAAEKYIRSVGGIALILHSQCQAQPFYEKNDYTSYSDIEDEQDCPHIWAKKNEKTGSR